MVIIKLFGVLFSTIKQYLLCGFFFSGFDMTSFTLLRRLGISRGWRIRLPNSGRLYAPPILYCLFIFALIRTRALACGLWVVAYYVRVVLKKYILHVFFWRTTGVKKYRIFKAVRVLTLTTERRKRLSGVTAVRIAIGPTRIRLLKRRKGANKKRIWRQLLLRSNFSRNLTQFWYLSSFLMFRKQAGRPILPLWRGLTMSGRSQGENEDRGT